MEPSVFFILLAFGLFGGFLSGLLGVGGGIIFIPIISHFLGKFDLSSEEFVRYLLANSFATIFFAGLISTFKQYRINQFFPKQIGLTGSTAMISSAVATYFIAYTDWYDETSFSILFVALLLFTIIRILIKKPADTFLPSETPNIKYPITGFLTGIVTAFSGLGGGVIMIPLFSQYIKLDMKTSAAISIGVIPLLLLPVIGTYIVASPELHLAKFQIGYIIPTIFLPMVLGLFIAAPMGVSMAQRLQDKVLKMVFSILVLIVIIKTIANIVG